MSKEKSLTELKRDTKEKERLFEQRAKEAEQGIEEQKIRVCRAFVERMANVYKDDVIGGRMKRSALKKKIIGRVCPKLWSEYTVRHNFPQWLLEPNFVGNTWNQYGKTGDKNALNRSISRVDDRRNAPEPEALVTDYHSTPVSSTTTRMPGDNQEEFEHDEEQDERYGSISHLIDDLSGLPYKERSNIENNRELVEKTKQHRFNLVKKMSDLDVKTTYSFCMLLDALLTDFLEQLDNELDVREKKSQMVSE
jgi:hypothetical protein